MGVNVQAGAAASPLPVPEPTLAALRPAPAQVPSDWPGRENSHSLNAGGVWWHLQMAGRPLGHAPVVLMLHGTGASTHSWRDLVPHLAPHFTLLMPDLPGHGFSSRPNASVGAATPRSASGLPAAGRPSGLSLPGMAAALAALLRTLQVTPALLVGHSAGAAIAARLCLDGGAQPAALFSINGAWFPPQGVAGWWYPPLAKLMAINPLAPHLMSWQAAQPKVLRRLLQGIGSPLPEEGLSWYRRLAADPQHVGAVIAMMAAWDLQPLLNDLPGLQPALHLLVGEGDQAVPPACAEQLRRRLPKAHIHRLPGLGHLAHEEAPQLVAQLILRHGSDAMAAASPQGAGRFSVG
jgi:magnesium chelatase accessory protein